MENELLSHIREELGHVHADIHLRPVAQELKTAAKRVDLSILVADKSASAGLGLRVRVMGKELIALIEEMHASGSVMHYDRISGECYLLIDGTLAISQRVLRGQKEGHGHQDADALLHHEKTDRA